MQTRFLFILFAIIACGHLSAKDLIVSVEAKEEFTGETIRNFKGWLVSANGNDTIRGNIKTSYDRKGIGQMIVIKKIVLSEPK